MPYQKIEKPAPMAAPMEVDMEEEVKLPTPAEARAKFDTMDAAPVPKKVSKVEFQPTGPPMVPVEANKQAKPAQRVPPKPAPKPEQAPKLQKSPSPRLLHDLLVTAWTEKMCCFFVLNMSLEINMAMPSC